MLNTSLLSMHAEEFYPYPFKENKMKTRKKFLLFTVATVLCIVLTALVSARLHRPKQTAGLNSFTQEAELPVVKKVKNKTKSIEVIKHEVVMKAGSPVILITMRNKSDEHVKAVTAHIGEHYQTIDLADEDYSKPGIAPDETATLSFSLLGLGSNDFVTIIGAEVGYERYEGDEEGVSTIRGIREHGKEVKEKKERNK
jgi:hypothetical protein